MRAATKAIAREIAAERERQQVVELHFPANDDRYVQGELARAASAYALYGGLHEHDRDVAKKFGPRRYGANLLWPWDDEHFKLTNPRRDLIKAAALIVAEIERLDRAAANGEGSE